MTIIGHYQLGEELGAGGMGTVYRGLHTQTEQTVAIKQLKNTIATDDTIERFRREGEALRELNHPNIVKMLDMFEYNGDHYLVMEYVSGGDLSDLIRQNNISLEQIVGLAIDLADALTRAHKLNIIHRDLKPSNVLIGDDGVLRLTDFGVSYIANEDRITDPDLIISTLIYTPPEVFDGEPYNELGDIWAFGLILFEMLCKYHPFDFHTYFQIVQAITVNPIPDLESQRPDLPIPLIDLVYRMLDRNPQSRIASVRIVGAELEAIIKGRSYQHQTPRFAPETPKSSTLVKSNLPAQTTLFIGRGHELDQLETLMKDDRNRLITIQASGGMGKTRLSLALGQQAIDADLFADGVYFVELANLNDANNIPNAIAEAASFQFLSGENPKQQLLKILSRRKLLLILDNYEHLPDGFALVSEILESAPDVKVIVTSRHRLSQIGEVVFELSGMTTPDRDITKRALAYESIELFVHSAKRVHHDFELNPETLPYVIHICKLVEGLPLGIILAASWMNILSVSEIVSEIEQGIGILEANDSYLPERQRSIHAVMDYSWSQMTGIEQMVFMKLSIFRGGFTREAAQSITGANLQTLRSLLNKSLIRRNADNGRYEIHELLRQYAEERLVQANGIDSLYEQYTVYFADFMATRINDIKGKRQLDGLNEIEADFDNIRIAWNYVIGHKNNNAISKMMETLILFCDMRTYYLIAEDLFQQAVQQLSIGSTATHLVYNQLRARYIQAWLLSERSPVPESIDQQLKESLVSSQANDDHNTTALCIWLQGELEWIRRDYKAALALYEQALAMYEQLNDPYYVGRVLRRSIYSLFAGGKANYTKSHQLNQKHLQITQDIGDKSGFAHAILYEGAHVDFEEGNRHLQTAISIWREMGDWKSLGIVLHVLSENLFLIGEFDRATIVLDEAQQLVTKVGWSHYVSTISTILTVIQQDTESSWKLQKPDQAQFTITSLSFEKHILLKALATAVFALVEKEHSRAYIVSALQTATDPFIPIAVAGSLSIVVLSLIDDHAPVYVTELFGLAFNYSDDYIMGWMKKWSRLQEAQIQLKAELGEDTYNQAWERGQSLDLETVVQDLIDEFSGDVD